MNKRKPLIATILVLILTLIIGGNTILYAFFNVTGGEGDVNASASITDTQPNTIIVSTPFELTQAVTDAKYNSNANVSSDRKTVRFSGDIALNSALNITADVNIDFNGFTLMTNGNAIEIRHFYHGIFDMFNGKIQGSGAEQINIYTPHAYVATDSLSLIGITINLVTFDTTEMFESVIAVIADKISGGGRYTLISTSATLNRNRYCRRHSTTADYNDCAYVGYDLDLPIGYGNFDLNIEYSSSNTAVLTNDGVIGSSAAGGITDVVLTAKISYNGMTHTKEFNLHIYDNTHVESKEIVAINELIERLERYYYVGELEGLGAVSLYYIPEAITLEKEYGGIGLVYETIGKNGIVVDSTVNNTEENFVISDDGKYWTMTLNDEITELRLCGAISGAEIRIPVNGQTSQNINDNYSKALKIARKLYGEEMVVTEEARDKELGQASGKNYANGYRAYTLVTDSSAYSSSGVLAISYTLTNNADATYTIADTTLKVMSANNPPTEIQAVNLCMSFKFNSEPQNVKINIPIRFDLQKKGDGNNIEQFLPYYNYFDRLLAARTNSFTYRDFKMPLGHGVRGAVYYYEIYNIDGTVNDKYINMSLAYTLNGVDYLKTVNEVIAMDSPLLQEIMLSGTAEWRMSFNIAELPVEDTQIILRYRYKFYGYDQSVWYGANEPYYESVITVTGIIKPENMHGTASGINDYMSDRNLYKYIYDCMRPNKSMAEYVYGSGNYLETNWLNAEFVNCAGGKELNLSGKKINDTAWTGTVTSIVSFDGLKFLKNVNTLNLSSASVSRSDIDYLSSMRIRELNLASNALSDRNIGTLNFPSGRNNGLINVLAGIDGLEKLHLENNKFYYFTDLTKLNELKEVCVFGNSFDGILAGVINGIYGTNGAINSSTYTRLTKNRVIVRNVSESEGYTPSAGGDDSVAMQQAISRLESISYQSVLSVGESITHAYDWLSTNPKDYGIPNMSWNHWLLGTPDDKLAFGFYDSEAETNTFYALFQYRVNTVLSTTWIDVYIDFDVIRI